MWVMYKVDIRVCISSENLASFLKIRFSLTRVEGSSRETHSLLLHLSTINFISELDDTQNSYCREKERKKEKMRRTNRTALSELQFILKRHFEMYLLPLPLNTRTHAFEIHYMYTVHIPIDMVRVRIAMACDDCSEKIVLSKTCAEFLDYSQ